MGLWYVVEYAWYCRPVAAGWYDAPQYCKLLTVGNNGSDHNAETQIQLGRILPDLADRRLGAVWILLCTVMELPHSNPLAGAACHFRRGCDRTWPPAATAIKLNFG